MTSSKLILHSEFTSQPTGHLLDAVFLVGSATGIQWKNKKPPNLCVEIKEDHSKAQRTRVIKRSLEPSWNEDFSMYVQRSTTAT
jgi:Ca2+-dependent lipid-binding protein